MGMHLPVNLYSIQAQSNAPQPPLDLRIARGKRTSWQCRSPPSKQYDPTHSTLARISEKTMIIDL